jgi:hypothetical protein
MILGSVQPDASVRDNMPAAPQSAVPNEDIANYDVPETLSPPQPTRDITTVQGAFAVQGRLIELGYFRGSADGIWGVQSRNALRKFRSKVMLENDDQWNFETETQLFDASAPKLDTRRPGRWRLFPRLFNRNEAQR